MVGSPGIRARVGGEPSPRVARSEPDYVMVGVTQSALSG